MPCNHKFKKYLNLDRLDFEPVTLIVGTFNPEWPAGNTAEWFYGGRDSIFWDILPKIYNEPGLMDAGPHEWKQFCSRNKIALTDLISCIDDADAGNPEHNKMLANFADKALVHHFDDFEFVDIVQLLRRHPSIKNVYLARGITEVFWRHLWNPVMHYCNANGIWERRLLPLSGYAFYEQGAQNDAARVDATVKQEDIILMRWQQEWHL